MQNIRQMDNGSHQKRDSYYLLLAKDSWSPKLHQATHLEATKTVELLRSRYSRFRLPISLGSHGCLAFMVKEFLNLAKVLKVDWKLKCA